MQFVSKEKLIENTSKLLEHAPSIALGVLTLLSSIAVAKHTPESLIIVIPLLIAGSATLIVRYQILKNKLKELRLAIDAMDDALADDRTTIEELRTIFLRFRKLLSR
jgi:ABC-type long-subunit fatty acid transport system fused permease/ATPase subunit